MDRSASPEEIHSRADEILDFIRTETVLSRLPVHNLAKKGNVKIQILRKTGAGETELLWKVSPSRDYGEPRQLAYKLETIVINQRIDEAGRPLPRILRIGSLSEICRELDLVESGKNKADLKQAFMQNASAFITAKFNYKWNDGTEHCLEAGFTRYSVVFTGEKLPDGRRADAIYIVSSDPYWGVINNAPVRPLDRVYMKKLPPAAQRFYEIISRKIFAAIKNNHAYAKLLYSEYCTFSAQVRHYERQPVQDQMAKLLRPHKSYGYIACVKYEPITDAQGRPDWILLCMPGPKARAEYAASYRNRRAPIPAEALEIEEQIPAPRRKEIAAPEPPPPPPVNETYLAELVRRGIGETEARRVLTQINPDQPVLDQLEYADSVIRHPRSAIRNAQGFYITRLLENLSVPENFETRAKREAREEAERREAETQIERQNLEFAYAEYRKAEVDRYIAAQMARGEFAAIVNEEAARARKNRDWKRLPEETIAGIADRMARLRVGKETAVPMLTFEEFCERERLSSAE